LSQNVLNLDVALQAIRQQIKENDQTNERIVYRSIDYDRGVDTIPYGKQVNVGDYVGDLGFLSTSEHRQFILGKEQTREVTGLLKLAIYGRSGAPIALHFSAGSQNSYTNPNEKEMYDINEEKKASSPRREIRCLDREHEPARQKSYSRVTRSFKSRRLRRQMMIQSLLC